MNRIHYRKGIFVVAANVLSDGSVTYDVAAQVTKNAELVFLHYAENEQDALERCDALAAAIAERFSIGARVIHVRTGKKGRVMCDYNGADLVMCDFGSCASPFTNVKRSELRADNGRKRSAIEVNLS